MSIEIERGFYSGDLYPHRFVLCGEYATSITTEQADYLDRLVECPAPGIFPLGDGTFLARGKNVPTDGTWQTLYDGTVVTAATRLMPKGTYTIAPVESPVTLAVPAHLADKIREAFPEVEG